MEEKVIGYALLILHCEDWEIEEVKYFRKLENALEELNFRFKTPPLVDIGEDCEFVFEGDAFLYRIDPIKFSA